MPQMICSIMTSKYIGFITSSIYLIFNITYSFVEVDLHKFVYWRLCGLIYYYYHIRKVLFLASSPNMVESIARSLMNNLQESSPLSCEATPLTLLGRKIDFLTRKNEHINLDNDSMFLEDYNEKRQWGQKHKKTQSNKQFVPTSKFACHRAWRHLKLCLA